MKKRRLTFFGQTVKKRLAELDMTQRELALELDINENYLTDILRGRRSGAKHKDAIEKRLGLDPEEDLSPQDNYQNKSA